ncbi:MAG: LacI family transcriptional regulator [Chloroflexi bacterium HGW-Chloroflexi-4]|jgi:LacI family transcriptional regulator|nr:MAG: LacI family transcriptional regulator [Chloroflexi bacterium HGW-Chloroflexi-4]
MKTQLDHSSGNLTLDDIARLAGVSRTTVSRVVNEHPSVRRDVRQRVLDIIEEHHFHPNAAARTLAMQRSWTIGLILPHSVSTFFTDPYYPNLLMGIAKACNLYNYTLALFLVSTKEDEVNVFPRVGRKGFLDGAIVQSGHHGDQGAIGRMVDKKMPLVVVGRPFRSDNVTYVDIDNIKAAKSAVTHLYKTGCRRIATITGPIDSTVGIDRLEGYRQAIKENNGQVNESLIAEGNFTETGGYLAMQKLLPFKPDGVFAASDVMASGAMKAVEDANLHIPEDVSFIGFDDLPSASYGSIQLSTVRQNVTELGLKSVESLIEQIEDESIKPRQIILDTELVIKQSCRPLKELHKSE